MTARDVAWKDLQDARAGSMLPVCLVFVAVFVGVTVATTLVPSVSSGGGPSGAGPDVGPLLAGAALFVGPYAAVILSYESVAAERATNTVRLLLCLPHTRWQVVTGLFLGRCGLLALGLAIGMLCGAAAGVLTGGTLSPVAVVAVYPIALGLAATYAGIGVGVSACTRSTTVAFAGTIAAAGFTLSWDLVWERVWIVLSGGQRPSGGPPAWLETVWRLDPVTAGQQLIGGLPLSVFAGSATAVDAAVGALLLVAWTVVPLAIGTWRFDRVDLSS